MSAVEIEGNWDEVAKGFSVKAARMWQAAQRGAEQGMGLFRAKIQREQMSGRPGLKAPTGNLRRSWHVRLRASGADAAVVLGTSTKYAAVHQFGSTIKHPGTNNGFGRGIPIPPHDIKMPKRLNILEDFVGSGTRIVSRRIARELFREAGR